MLTRTDLWSLEAYAEQRTAFRAMVMGHKKQRMLPFGDHLSLLFEDRLTMHYQIQEMLRIEKIFEAVAIQDELDAYNPLIPEGHNWKATLLIEYPDETERMEKLRQLRGVAGRIYLQVDGFFPLFACSDEDMVRETEHKTSAVHFLRFEVPIEQRQSLRQGKKLAAGVDHWAYSVPRQWLHEALRQQLLVDLTD